MSSETKQGHGPNQSREGGHVISSHFPLEFARGMTCDLPILRLSFFTFPSSVNVHDYVDTPYSMESPT